MNFYNWCRVYLEVRANNGSELTALCVFHDDTKPSMRVNYAKAVFFCHACGARGGARKLIERVAPQTLSDVLRGSNIVTPTIVLRKGLERLSGATGGRSGPLRVMTHDGRTAPRSERVLESLYSPSADYHWSGRNISSASVAKWQLGYHLGKHALSIPMRSVNGDFLGITYRYLDHESLRYRYPAHLKVSDHLWGAWEVDDEKVVITEGFIDAMAVWQTGHRAVALGGSHMSPRQLTLLRKMGVTQVLIMLDGDAAGAAATDELYRTLKPVMRRVESIWLPRKTDPASLNPASLSDYLRPFRFHITH